MSAIVHDLRTTTDTTPWYRQPWPWLLMAGPFIVVIAAFYTLYLAIESSDGLVSNDYYKKGLMVNHTLHASALAEQLGLVATLHLTQDEIGLRLATKRAATGDNVFIPPETLRLMLSHPTRAGSDQVVILKKIDDRYRGNLHLPSSGHWLVLVEDLQQSWRLLGKVELPVASEFVIGSGVVAPPVHKLPAGR